MSLNRIIDTGSYLGNGTSQIVVIGWQPAVVFITSSRSSGPPGGRAISFKNEQMLGDDFLANSSQADFMTANGITITATGFSIGAEQTINHNNTVFYWWAIRKSPSVDTGTYSGVGIGNPSIVTGRQPSVVLVAQHTGDGRYGVKFSTLALSNAMLYRTEIVNNLGITITATGFTTTGSAFNIDGASYSYVCLYDLVGSTRHFQSGQYSGTNLFQNIALGRQPQAVHILGRSDEAAMKSAGMPGNDFGHLDTAYSWETGVGNGITLVSQGFDADLGWSVSGKTYDYFAVMR